MGEIPFFSLSFDSTRLWEKKETPESLRCLLNPWIPVLLGVLYSEVGADVPDVCWVSHGLKEALFIFFKASYANVLWRPPHVILQMNYFRATLI